MVWLWGSVIAALRWVCLQQENTTAGYPCLGHGEPSVCVLLSVRPGRLIHVNSTAALFLESRDHRRLDWLLSWGMSDDIMLSVHSRERDGLGGLRAAE